MFSFVPRNVDGRGVPFVRCTVSQTHKGTLVWTGGDKRVLWESERGFSDLGGLTSRTMARPFFGAPQGPCPCESIFMYAEDVSLSNTGWVNKGTWTPAADQAPSVVSVTPTPATGLSNTFALTYSSPNGATNLDVVEVDFGSAVRTGPQISRLAYLLVCRRQQRGKDWLCEERSLYTVEIRQSCPRMYINVVDKIGNASFGP
jgi:hypothetical protein